MPFAERTRLALSRRSSQWRRIRAARNDLKVSLCHHLGALTLYVMR